MIIDRYGTILDSFMTSYGIVVHDGKYAICLEYESEEDVKKKQEALRLRNELRTTDYQAIKYAEGCYTEAEYAEKKAYRQLLRDQVNEIELAINNPTISDEGKRLAEEIAEASIELNELKNAVDGLSNAFCLMLLSSEYRDANTEQLKDEYWKEHGIQEKVDKIHSLQKNISEKKEIISGGI